MVFEFLNTALDGVLGPLLSMPPLLAVILLSFLLSLVTVLIYKWTTNQQLMKQLKDEIKALQSEAKELKDNPTKAVDVQKKAMETNMKYMSHSMRPTLITFLPIILIFGWMNSHFGFEQILPNQEFLLTVTAQDKTHGNITISVPQEIALEGKSSREITAGVALFSLKGKEGKHTIKVNVSDQEYTKDVIITNERKYEEPQTMVNDKVVKTIAINNPPLIITNLFGWHIGWLGSYIISSILFSTLLRKWMMVY